MLSLSLSSQVGLGGRLLAKCLLVLLGYFYEGTLMFSEETKQSSKK